MKFGVRGVKGSEAVARQLGQLAPGHRHTVTAQRGLLARLNYLTRTGKSRAAWNAGLTVSDRTLKAWLEGERSPSIANLERIDAVYRAVPP